MAAKLTDDERAHILELCEAGETCNEIARITGRSTSSVSNVARAAGHRFGQTNAARAREARSAYTAERRANLAARFTVEAELLLDQLHQEHVAFNFGGKDNDYAEHLMPEPPVDAKRALIQSAREAVRTVLDIDRHDNKADEGAADVDRYLRELIGDTVQAVAG